ncbi:MAG: hypothetical protein ABSH06_10905 [Thermodesulfobacteriota bacterium]
MMNGAECDGMSPTFWQAASRFFLTIENENLGSVLDIGQKRMADSGWLMALLRY